jgi:hypothetical protein
MLARFKYPPARDRNHLPGPWALAAFLASPAAYAGIGATLSLRSRPGAVWLGGGAHQICAVCAVRSAPPPLRTGLLAKPKSSDALFLIGSGQGGCHE